MEKETLLIAVNICHSEYFWGDEEGIIHNAFSKSLSRVSGVIVFGNATLGNEHSAPVKLYKNPNRHIPGFLQFLERETSSRELLFLQ